MHDLPFVGLVRRFLDVARRCEEFTLVDFLTECALVLPQVYSLGIALPLTDVPDDAPDPVVASVPVPDFRRVLTGHDDYAEVFDPITDRDHVITTISDDLGDIFGELSEPLATYDSGVASLRAQAVSAWGFAIRSHCGDHLVDVMRPIHRLLFLHLRTRASSTA